MKERDVCNEVQFHLERNGISFKRERKIGKQGRIDFGIYNVLGIECKGELSSRVARNNPEKLINQIGRYKTYYKYVWLVLPNNFLITDVADRAINIKFFKDYIYEIDKLIGNSI